MWVGRGSRRCLATSSSRSRRAHDRDELARGDVEADAAERVDGDLTVSMALDDVAQRDDRCGAAVTHRRLPPHPPRNSPRDGCSGNSTRSPTRSPDRICTFWLLASPSLTRRDDVSPLPSMTVTTERLRPSRVHRFERKLQGVAPLRDDDLDADVHARLEPARARESHPHREDHDTAGVDARRRGKPHGSSEPLAAERIDADGRLQASPHLSCVELAEVDGRGQPREVRHGGDGRRHVDRRAANRAERGHGATPRRPDSEQPPSLLRPFQPQAGRRDPLSGETDLTR